MSLLNGNRPATRAVLWCLVCNAPVTEWYETGLHCAGFTLPGFEHLRKDHNKPETLLSGEGITLINAKCHGHDCCTGIPFSVVAKLTPKDRIELFGEMLTINGQEPTWPEELTTFYDPATGLKCDPNGNLLPGQDMAAARKRIEAQRALPDPFGLRDDGPDRFLRLT